MNPGPKKANRYTAMFTKATPYEVAASTQAVLWVLLFVLICQPRAWIELFSVDSLLFLIPFTCVFAWLIAFGVMHLGRRHSAVRNILALQKQLPWFGAEPVTVTTLPPREELDEVLHSNGYETLHLDGTSIASWHDLAEAMQALVGPMQWPADERQKVRALLTYLASDKPTKRALIWHNASVAATENPALVPSFAAAWSAYALNHPPGLLVFIDLPQRAEPDDATATEPLLRGDSGPDPDRSILKDAPEGSWWKPKPGELTR